MTGNHPDPLLLERFMRNETDARERRAIIRHLLAGCPRCSAVTGRLWSFGEARPDLPVDAGVPDPAAYGRVLEDVARRGARRERRARLDREAAPRRLAELRELAPAQRRERIAAGRRFHTPAFCDLLIEESRRAGGAGVAAEWAGLAVGVAERLDPRRHGATLVHSFQARAWSGLGEARRRLGDLQGAEAALAAAGRALEDGADPLDRAELLETQARLLAQRGRLDDLEKAETLLGRALALYRALGERHLEGRVLILAAAVRSRCSRSGGDEGMRETLGRLRQGLVRLEEDREPALAAAASHRLALLLAETGRGQEALAPLRRARSLYERLEDGPNSPNLARLRHLEGTIAQALDSPEEAETAFQQAMRELLLAGLGTEAARALLDLALLYTRQGRSEDVQRLVGELYPICRVRGVGLSVVTSLLFFRRLVETGHATPEVLFQVARFLADPPRAQRPALW
jgi:tetratricopeptide (TPR) repeat protein